MSHRDFDYGRYDYGYDYSTKRPRHRLDKEPLFDRDDGHLEARLASAERAIRELAAVVGEQDSLIEKLRAEASQALDTECSLKAQVQSLGARVADLQERLGEPTGDGSIQSQLDRLECKVNRQLGPDSESSDERDSDVGSDPWSEGEGEESDQGDESDEAEW